jgi:hypothetical protein
MPRKPWKLKRCVAKLSPVAVAYLSDDDAAEDGEALDTWTLWCYRHGMPGWDGDPLPRDLWERYGADFLRAYISVHPCRRPVAWWQWSAPRWRRVFGAWFDGTLPEPRLRLGGVGTPRFEALSVAPVFDRGIPVGWVRPRDVIYYNGRLTPEERGWPPCARKPQEGDFTGVPIDPRDPPTFESEAAYLDRHGLLTPAEKKHLASHPELLEPVIIEPDEEEDFCENYIPSLAKSERAAPC